MGIEIRIEPFRCDYRYNYRYSFTDAITQEDQETLKRFMVMRNRQLGLGIKRFIVNNFENVIFLVLKGGAALLSGINTSSSNKGVTGYRGIYFTNEQLTFVWYFIDNIVLRFLENGGVPKKEAFCSEELYQSETSIGLSNEFFYAFEKFRSGMLKGNSIQSFAIGYQLESLPLKQCISLFPCETAAEESKRFPVNFSDVKKLFNIEDVRDYEDAQMRVWSPDKLRKLYSKKYRRSCKEIKKEKKQNKCLKVWKVEGTNGVSRLIETEDQISAYNLIELLQEAVKS